MATVHKAKLSAMEHIKPFDGAMLALLSLSDPDLQTKLDPEIDITLWAFAISIIVDMRSNVNLDVIKQDQGFRVDNLNECTVEDSRLFTALDQFVRWIIYVGSWPSLFIFKLYPLLLC